MSRNTEIKVRYFPGVKAKDMYHYAISLLEKKPENILLHLDTNDAPLNLVLMFWKIWLNWRISFRRSHPAVNKITLSSPAVRTDRENVKKNNENLTNRLKKQGIPYIAHDNIAHKHLYRDGLHLNSVGFSIRSENFLS